MHISHEFNQLVRNLAPKITTNSSTNIRSRCSIGTPDASYIALQIEITVQNKLQALCQSLMKKIYKTFTVYLLGSGYKC